MSFSRNDIRDALIEMLGKRTDLSDAIELEIRFAQQQLEEEPDLPWFLLAHRATASTVAGDERMEMPTGFIREFDDGGEKGSVEVQDDSDWYELRKLSAGDLDKEFGNVASARPEAYALVGTEFIFGPVPDAVYTVRIRTYYKAADELTDDSTNAWTIYAPDMLIAATGKRMAHGYLKDAATKQQFDQMYLEAYHRLAVQSAAREEAGMVRILNETYP